MFRIVAVRRTVAFGKLGIGRTSTTTKALIVKGRKLHLSAAVDCDSGSKNGNDTSTNPKRKPITMANKDEMLKKLTAQQFRVTQEAETERPFTGKYWDHKGNGVYHCAVCDTPLFSSTTKYDSGSGWPSFYDALKSAEAGGGASNVTRKPDNSHGMTRIEVLCKNCDAHLGHEFDDGPTPTGTRFCINSASLCFQEKKK